MGLKTYENGLTQQAFTNYVPYAHVTLGTASGRGKTQNDREYPLTLEVRLTSGAMGN